MIHDTAKTNEAPQKLTRMDTILQGIPGTNTREIAEKNITIKRKGRILLGFLWLKLVKIQDNF